MSYFDWLVSFTQFKVIPLTSRDHDILWKLFCTPYRYTIARDVNRSCEGSMLRDQYSAKFAEKPETQTYECSMLEMMVALSIRCDATITLDETDANPNYWFEIMWDSLGLNDTSRNVDYIIGRFNSGSYCWNGDGGLFYIPNLDPKIDMPKYELWAQMNLYMNYLYG